MPLRRNGQANVTGVVNGTPYLKRSALAYLHPEKNTRSVNTASVVQARQPISKKSLSGWKNYKELLEPALKLIRKSELFVEYNL